MLMTVDQKENAYMKKNENDNQKFAGACVGSMGKEFNLHNNVQFYCFQMF